MLDYLEHLFHCEILNGLQSSILSTPWQWRSIFPIGLKLQQGVIYAIEEDLIVDMLTLCEEILSLNDLGRLELVWVLVILKLLNMVSQVFPSSFKL